MVLRINVHYLPIVVNSFLANEMVIVFLSINQSQSHADNIDMIHMTMYGREERMPLFLMSNFSTSAM